MSEPTIDEMLAILAYLEQGTLTLTDRDMATIKAIRAILEQHPMAAFKVCRYSDHLEAIRAFVERVAARQREADVTTWPCIEDELAAMEKETAPK